MKIKQIIYAFGLFSLLVSCGDNLADLNVDPNTSPTARPEEVFTSGIGYYGIALDGYINETDALFAQYWAGGPGVALLDHERYFFEPGDFNTEWTFAYRQSLSDLDFVIKNGNDALSGAAQILTALIYQNMVDHYGNIPYSEALKGAIEDGGVLTPVYDDAKVIYSDLLLKIDESMVKLNKPDNFGQEDLIYQGDKSKWLKLANSLKLRLLMRQSIVDPTVGLAVKSLIENGDFISSASDMAVVPFSGGATNNWNPQYARREQGIGMFYVASSSFVDYLDGIDDPRLNILFNPSASKGVVTGLYQGIIDDLQAPAKADYSFPSSVSYGPSNAVILMSTWEVMFLRSEASMRFGTSDNDKVMYENAVKNHFEYIGATGADEYLSTNATYDSGASITAKSNLIGRQKWISMCGLQESEGWIEARRFDTPESRIFTDNGAGIFNTPTRTVLGSGVFPNLRLYPQSELSFNPNSPKDRKITDRVFWDN